MISRRDRKAVLRYALAPLAMVFMSAPCSAADAPQPLRLTPENGHDFLCHLYLYNAYTNLTSGNGSEDSIKTSYAVASYFMGKLIGRNGDNFSVAADAVQALKTPYAAADKRSEFMRGCLDEYNAVFGKIEERQG